MRSLSIAILSYAVAAHALVTPRSTQPTVSLSYATFQGITSGNITQYLGIPFAQPPVNELRFQRPQAPLHVPGVTKADKYGAACPQQTFATVPDLTFPPSNYTSVSEDCLFLNVIRPATLTTTKGKLPVAFWIHGGGFETGDSSDPSNTAFVQRSIDIGQPILLVTANYRLSAFGFLGGKEVAAAGVANLGLHDQIMALQWVQNFISSFGGDPTKVTLFGTNAGAISATTHLLINDGKPNNMFRGAFMLSGGPSSISHVNDGQDAYDQLVQATQCTKASDTLECLRKAPFNTLMAAIMKSPGLFSFSSLANEWKIRVDGDLVKRSLLCSVSQGLYAKVPVVSGSCDDEGSIFALSNLNITTDAEFAQYMQTFLLKGTTSSQINAVQKAYPADPTQGSPFNTGTNNTLTPEYKRLGAIQGDIVFQGPRRFFLEAVSKTQKTWSYLYKRGKSTPDFGAFHGIDLNDWFAIKSTDFVAADSLIRFVNNLDPNPPTGKNQTFWPEYGSSNTNPPMLTFTDPAGISISPDTYRATGFSLTNQIIVDQAHQDGIC